MFSKAKNFMVANTARISVLLAANSDSTQELPPPKVSGNMRNRDALKMSKIYHVSTRAEVAHR